MSFILFEDIVEVQLVDDKQFAKGTDVGFLFFLFFYCFVAPSFALPL